MIVIHAGEVHLWTGQLRGEVHASFWSLLNETEQARAKRFVRDRDRCRYVWARGNLRRILADYVGDNPQSLAFDYGDRGKPYLVETSVQFNLSHSGDWVVYGVTCDRAIGVDIEEIQPPKDWLALAERFFCPAEVAQLRSLPIAQQTVAFFKLWTRKEACLKATGEGLQGLQTLELDWQLAQQQVANSHHQWQVFNLEHIPDCAGAIAIQGRPQPLSQQQTLLGKPPSGLGFENYDSSNFTHFSLPA